MARRGLPDTRVTTIPRTQFLSRVWDYANGEHVSFVGPTGSGKTYLAYQLLGVSTSKARQGVVLVMKPRDATVTAFAARSHYRIVRSWPPAPSIWQPSKPPGWVVWPPHTMNPRMDNLMHYRVFASTLRDVYARGAKGQPTITFADEVYSLINEIPAPSKEDPGLDELLIRQWSKGRSLDAGLWGATQRPAWVPQWMYSEVQHIFLARVIDRRAQQRFGEISGVDQDLVVSVVSKLPKYHWLYIRQEDQTMCVVGP